MPRAEASRIRRTAWLNPKPPHRFYPSVSGAMPTHRSFAEVVNSGGKSGSTAKVKLLGLALVSFGCERGRRVGAQAVARKVSDLRPSFTRRASGAMAVAMPLPSEFKARISLPPCES